MNLLFIYLLLSNSVSASDELIASSKITFNNVVAGYNFEIEQHSIPSNMLASAISEVLKREKNPQLTISYDSASTDIYDKIIAGVDKSIPTRSFEEQELNKLLPPEIDRVSTNEQNGLRTLLIIRCVGLGSGLFVGTGSSLAIAAYAGIFNYILMEALYIPKRSGHMPGVDFVSALMSKTTSIAKGQNPSISKKRLGLIEASTNFIINYTMNFAMLVPFLGMTGADFSAYIDAFSSSELYIRSARFAMISTLFLSSWKMAASRWEKLRAEGTQVIVSPKSQGRIINGIDFGASFVTPGFWAGHLDSTIVVISIGVSGFVSYFYYDLKKKLGAKFNYFDRINAKSCSSLFAD